MTARVVAISRRNRSRNSLFALTAELREPPVLLARFGVRRAGVPDPLRDGLLAFVRAELRRARFELFFMISPPRRSYPIDPEDREKRLVGLKPVVGADFPKFLSRS
jgi:hypothetical protein